METSELQRFVPKELEIDLYEGKAWVSVVLFAMDNIRPRLLPAFPPISNFTEINVRTYVKNGHKAGVYFLSIEGGTKLSCKIAKRISELPYRYSNIKRTENQYESYNSEFNDKLYIKFTTKKEINEKSKLDKWLTERYALFQDTDNTINEFQIHHLEWSINEVSLKKIDFNYKRFSKLIKKEPNKIQYSKGVKVIAWGKTKYKKNAPQHRI